MLQPFCKPPEHQLWFNSGILLGSSLTLTPAGTACAGLKGKAGAELGTAPAFSSHGAPEAAKAEQEQTPSTKGFEHQLEGGSRAHSGQCCNGEHKSRAAGSASAAPQGSQGRLRGIQCSWAGSACRHKLNPAPAETERGRRRAGQCWKTYQRFLQGWQVVGTPGLRGSSLPTHAAQPVMQKASAPPARRDNTRREGGTLRKNTIPKAAAPRAERSGAARPHRAPAHGERGALPSCCAQPARPADQ